MASPLPPVTTGTSQDYIGRMTALASQAFVTDGFPTVVLRERHGIHTASQADLADHYRKRVETKIRAGAVIVEAGSWAAAGIWEGPIQVEAGTSTKRDDVQEHSRSLAELIAKSDAAKVKYLGVGRKYWYLSLMAREPGNRRKGAVRAVLEPYLRRAKAEGCPVWLGAGIERAKDVYEYLGFRVVEHFVTGIGEYDIDGMPEGNKEGIPTWLMVKDP